MKTVLFVESGGSGGGSFLSLKLLLESLDKSRFRPVVAFLNRTRFLEEYRAMGVDARLVRDLVYTSSVPRFLRRRMEKLKDRAHQRFGALAPRVVEWCHGPALRTLEGIVREQGVELLYSNNQPNRNLFMAHLARRTGLPLVCHLRSRGIETYTPDRARFFDASASAYVAISEEIRRIWTSVGVPEHKTHLVYNGIPELAPAPLALRPALGLPEGTRLLGIVSRVVWEKGHATLLRALPEVLRAAPAHLLVVGDGPMREPIERLATELGVSSSVTFTGYVGNPLDYVAAMDVLVQPCDTDSFSRSVLEAWRLGVPTVCSDTGSIREGLKDGLNGLVVPAGDVPGFARAINRVLTEEGLGGRLAAGALEIVSNRFDLRLTTSRIESIMEEALEGAAEEPSAC
ncbi:MAG: glycosyltransferase family 4 protein [Desulfovibrionaceae bacterium]